MTNMNVVVVAFIIRGVTAHKTQDVFSTAGNTKNTLKIKFLVMYLGKYKHLTVDYRLCSS